MYVQPQPLFAGPVLNQQLELLLNQHQPLNKPSFPILAAPSLKPRKKRRNKQRGFELASTRKTLKAGIVTTRQQNKEPEARIQDSIAWSLALPMGILPKEAIWLIGIYPRNPESILYIGFVSNKGNYKPGPQVRVNYKPKQATTPAEGAGGARPAPPAKPAGPTPTVRVETTKPSCTDNGGVCVNIFNAKKGEYWTQLGNICTNVKTISALYDCSSDYPYCILNTDVVCRAPEHSQNRWCDQTYYYPCLRAGDPDESCKRQALNCRTLYGDDPPPSNKAPQELD